MVWLKTRSERPIGYSSRRNTALLELQEPQATLIFDGHRFSPKPGRSGDPATLLSWYGAVACCNWLSALDGLTPAYHLGAGWARIPSANGYRLPTEAEWECAAAWEQAAERPWAYGVAADFLDETRANYGRSNPAHRVQEPFTTPIGYFDGQNETQDSPSPNGLYDMSGNVAEWCQDRMGAYPDTPVENPQGSRSRAQRIYRGGSWESPATECACVFRAYALPHYATPSLGFRLARSPQRDVLLSEPFSLDTKAPQVVSFTATSASPTKEDRASFEVCFSEVVQGFDRENEVGVVHDGLPYTGLSIVMLDEGTRYAVTFTGLEGSGALTAWVVSSEASGTGVRDLAGHALTGAPLLSATIEIDQEAPHCRCQDIRVALSETGSVSITPEMVVLESGDNLGIVVYALDRSLFACDDLGPAINVELVVRDAAENSASCSAAVTLEDPGAICFDTFTQVLQTRFAHVDLNADKRLDATELEAAQLSSWPRHLALIDANQDGLLQVSELLAVSEERIAHSADINGDQHLDVGELLRVIQFFNLSFP